MLPHLRDRAVTLVHWPDGVEKPSFFEKNVSRHAPEWIRTARVGTPGGRSEKADFPLIDDAAQWDLLLIWQRGRPPAVLKAMIDLLSQLAKQHAPRLQGSHGEH